MDVSSIDSFKINYYKFEKPGWMGFYGSPLSPRASPVDRLQLTPHLVKNQVKIVWNWEGKFGVLCASRKVCVDADHWPGKGFYGDVLLSKAFGIRSGESESLVLVKSLLSHHDVYQAEFYREVDLFSRTSHDHVVRLLGVCREMEPVFLITEYCEWVRMRCRASRCLYA